MIAAGSAVAVVLEAARLKLALRVEGTRIIARPMSAVTPELKAMVAAHRADLLALLKSAVRPPKSTCACCCGKRFFARPERLIWICARCHPTPTPDAMVWHDVAEPPS